MEMAMSTHARAENMRYLLKGERAGTPVDDPPYPRPGSADESAGVCFAVAPRGRAAMGQGVTPSETCQCANTMRYGPMETAGDEHDC